MFRTAPRMAGFVFRENRVPFYQRLFQQHDGKRQWWKTDRSPYVMYPYLLSVYGLGLATTYAMGRMVFVSTPFKLVLPLSSPGSTDTLLDHRVLTSQQGHKTWFGKN
ncbi:cytochrome c oxidase subunit 7 [Aspergillus melleus]|uniref:cytochrome c oxidase subunit 7 n=1 Tax=Aspergillus melleus TaxID=138277 RepID=UPI001E8DCD21|nr:uncharacterized protein LDX57_006099 [Aspergillus melleus]KAH8428401.1 hypothetical protein LDX57_006099 [Aspergillus melleus]